VGAASVSVCRRVPACDGGLFGDVDFATCRGRLDIDVSGVDMLTLCTESDGDNFFNHGDWAIAKVET
jgi:hypothetical protein